MPRATACSILPRCCSRPSLLLRPTPPSTLRTVRCRSRRLYPLPFRLTSTAQRRANSEQILDIGQNLGFSSSGLNSRGLVFELSDELLEPGVGVEISQIVVSHQGIGIFVAATDRLPQILKCFIGMVSSDSCT